MTATNGPAVAACSGRLSVAPTFSAADRLPVLRSTTDTCHTVVLPCTATERSTAYFPLAAITVELWVRPGGTMLRTVAPLVASTTSMPVYSQPICGGKLLSP